MLFKLFKRDHLINFHPKFLVMHNLLKTLCVEKVKYMQETKSQIINIISGSEFLQFMYYLESLVIKLFEKYGELGSNILHYINNNFLTNLHLNQMFITV